MKTGRKKKRNNFNSSEIQELFDEFGVKTEGELLKKLDQDSYTLKCSMCGKEYIITSMRFPYGDPLCLNCYYDL